MGRLVVIEGIDGSGKETQSRLLAAAAEKRGERPLRVSFPNYASDSSAPARMYLDGLIGETPGAVNAYAASSFFAVDRYISYKTSWESEYAAGRVILANRYTTSNLTHQLEKLPPESWDPFCDWLCNFEYVKLGLPIPSLVIYLDMHETIGQKLLEQRYLGNNEKKDIHERDGAYLHRCRRAGLFAARRLGWQIVRCFDESTMLPLPEEEIARQVNELVESLLFS